MFAAVVRAALYFAGGMAAATLLSEVINRLLPIIKVGLSTSSQTYTTLESVSQNLPVIVLVGALVGLIAAGIAERRAA